MADKAKNINFRKFCTVSGKDIVCGKSAEQNELVVEQAGDEELVLHTKAPGSPFCNIKGKATKEDVKETSIICAAFSKAWKTNKSDVEVHVFKGKNIFKGANMKPGTFGVKSVKSIIAKKSDIERFLGDKK
jgi:predicted ribosome quality control (RQC) complex YloA/Tae2 family protein